MNSSVFPSELKIAKVLPLFKGENHNILSNFRPISILPVFSKIFEKLIQTRLCSFLTKRRFQMKDSLVLDEVVQLFKLLIHQYLISLRV